VLFLGRINFKKGLDLLISAFSMVKKALPTAQLAIVGPDNEGFGRNIQKWCREHEIENDIHLIDHLTPDKVRQAYVDADVFVLPSYTANFGVAVIEAMSCRCPVVISDQVNIWPDVNKSKAGIVVKLEIQEIANAILSVLKNKDLAKRMGDEGRKAVQNHYACNHIAKKVIMMYESIISQSYQ
jgi:glycosyltransferase involved in cell wall biosynthesis